VLSLLLHIDAFEEVIDAIVSENAIVEFIYRSVYGGFSAQSCK
jgi:hypothetical protein